MATIDHLYFPHIIDLIWQYLDYEGQLVTRAACKDWKTRADARLDHIVISCFERQKLFHNFDISTRDLASSSSVAWLGYVSHWHDSAAHEWNEYDYDELGRPVKFTYSRGEKLANHLERNIVASTTVVDLVGFDLKWPNVPPRLSENTLLRATLLDSECIVRCFGVILNLSDFKDYCYLHHDCKPSLVDVYMLTLGLDPPFQLLYPFDLSMRQDVQVINYLCFSDPTASHRQLPSLWRGYCDDQFCPVTVILRHGVPPNNRAPPSKEPGLVAVYADLVHGGNEVTIVGLEEFLDLEDTEGYIDIIEREVLKGRHKYDYDQDDEVWWVPKESCLDNLHFMTHEEYREHVGEELYRIHAVR